MKLESYAIHVKSVLHESKICVIGVGWSLGGVLRHLKKKKNSLLLASRLTLVYDKYKSGPLFFLIKNLEKNTYTPPQTTISLLMCPQTTIVSMSFLNYQNNVNVPPMTKIPFIIFF
jgi:hypothetical protein